LFKQDAKVGKKYLLHKKKPLGNAYIWHFNRTVKSTPPEYSVGPLYVTAELFVWIGLLYFKCVYAARSFYKEYTGGKMEDIKNKMTGRQRNGTIRIPVIGQ
jgi:hypothetical protein